jgi:hypothetical protein
MTAVEVAPGSIVSSGNSTTQGEKAKGHLGVKGHPLGRSTSEGGEPSIATRFSRRSSIDGIDLRSPHAYGCCGELKSSRAGPYSIARPAYMTSTVSAVSAMTPRS